MREAPVPFCRIARSAARKQAALQPRYRPENFGHERASFGGEPTTFQIAHCRGRSRPPSGWPVKAPWPPMQSFGTPRRADGAPSRRGHRTPSTAPISRTRCRSTASSLSERATKSRASSRGTGQEPASGCGARRGARSHRGQQPRDGPGECAPSRPLGLGDERLRSFPAAPAGGHTLLPAPVDPVSHFNADGRWIVNRDEPKEELHPHGLLAIDAVGGTRPDRGTGRMSRHQPRLLPAQPGAAGAESR
jgi:hypothetical protein